MVHVEHAELTQNLKFGKVTFVAVEWWPESPHFALLKYEIDGQLQPKGVRLDLDKKAILDDLDDDISTQQMLDNVADIWDEAVKALATTIWPKYQNLFSY